MPHSSERAPGPHNLSISTSGLDLLVGDMRFTQIELALDPAPRLILELAAAKKFINAPPFGSDQ
jgi:hypothetical protein